jgi:hypothetical protein
MTSLRLLMLLLLHGIQVQLCSRAVQSKPHLLPGLHLLFELANHKERCFLVALWIQPLVDIRKSFGELAWLCDAGGV